MIWIHMLILTLIHWSYQIPLTKDVYEDFAVEFKDVNDEDLHRIADDHGMSYEGKIGSLEGVYHFKRRKMNRLKRNAKDISNHEKVVWIEKQKRVYRSKRDFQTDTDSKNSKHMNEEQNSRFNDPFWNQQWYLFDNQNKTNSIKYDLNVVPVWNMNITGRGVKVTIIDDGIQYDHPDLKKNYDPKLSYDFSDNDDDPTPDLKNVEAHNEHGTRCASEVGMEANNGICGVGIAYNSKIGALRILDGKLTHLIEAKGLGFNQDYVDIYSASWGPTDNGKQMEKPSKLVIKVFEKGVKKGRNGLGNLYVWANGNGGMYDDSCSCDGYTSSKYVISVSSILDYNKTPKYLEACPSTMTSTYSAHSLTKHGIVAANAPKGCITTHSGTSASAPLAAGVFALVLEANPKLTWRDIKHLVAWSSQTKSIKNVKGWYKNGAGFLVHKYYGFGILDAANMVKYAQKWISVPEWQSCTVTKEDFKLEVSEYQSRVIKINTDKCKSKIRYIETVEVTMSFVYSQRGYLTIKMQPPTGYNTTLLYPRKLDRSGRFMNKWPFTSVHQWGERAGGMYEFFIEDIKPSEAKDRRSEKRSGTVNYLTVTFYGTATIPGHVKKFGKSRKQRRYENSFQE